MFIGRYISVIIISYTQIMNQQYIEVPIENKVIGQYGDFVTKQQMEWRTIQDHEQHPYVKIAKFYRNIQYTNKNTRTPKCLREVLNYIYNNHVPRMPQFFQKQQPDAKLDRKTLLNERDHFLSFIEERLKAIKCEYYVQGVIPPIELLQIFRLNTVVQILRDQLISGKGIDQIIGEGGQYEYELVIKDIRSNYQQQYIQALSYGLFLKNRQQLLTLIVDHPIILTQPKLSQLFKLRRQIDLGNYQKYFNALENHQNLVIRCILWNRIEQFRELILNIIKKCKLKVQKRWINKILGKEQLEEGYIQSKDLQGLIKSGQKVVRVGIRKWAKIKHITSYLLQRRQQDYNNNSLQPQNNQ